MLPTSSRSGNSKRCGVSAARSLGPISGSSRISAKVRSMASRNSVMDLNTVIGGRSLGRSHYSRPAMSAPIGLQPTAPLAKRVLLPGDPGRALLLAQSLLEEPKMFNHHRGLWGYSGTASDGAPLTIQSTGMGGPSAAIVVQELVDLGARRLVRVGTCGALQPALRLGQLVLATEAIAADGTSRALGVGDRIAASRDLLTALDAAADHAGPIVTTGPVYDRREPEPG